MQQLEKGYMKILKLIGFVVLFGCISLFSVNPAYGRTDISTKSNTQVSDLQTQKKTTILNRLVEDGLILTGDAEFCFDGTLPF